MVPAILALTVTQPNLPPMETVTLLIFRSGKQPQGISQEAISEMQSQHLANLGRLFTEKKAPCAGPFENGGEDRGIVILQLPKSKVAAEFESDPYVKNGILTLELHEWTVPKNLFTYEWNDKMNKGTLGWVKTGPNPDQFKDKDLSKEFGQHIEHNLNLMRKGVAGLVGPANSENDRGRGFYLFLTDDQEKIREINQKDPLIKSGYFVMEMKTLYFGDGLFKLLK